MSRLAARCLGMTRAVAALGCTGSPPEGVTLPVRSQEEDSLDLVDLTSGTIVVGVLPSLGGRVVPLHTLDGENPPGARPARSGGSRRRPSCGLHGV